VNSDCIATVKERQQPGTGRLAGSTIYTKDGAAIKSSLGVKQIETLMAPVIPAQPGYYVVDAIPPDTDVQDWIFQREPVIAWRGNEWGRLCPVTPFELSTPFELISPAILCPDGRVVQDLDDGRDSCETYDAWVTAEKARWDRILEARKAAAEVGAEPATG
jgi:hypothetical protein